MRENGYSLIELLVVIAIIGILAAVGTMQFNRYTKKIAMETQVRTMFADLQQVRSAALFEKRPRSVKITASTFSIYSSNVTTVSPTSQKTYRFAMTSNLTGGGQVDFDVNGLAGVGVSGGSVCLAEYGNQAAIDSLVIFSTRLQLGKWDQGGDCTSGNISKK